MNLTKNMRRISKDFFKQNKLPTQQIRTRLAGISNFVCFTGTLHRMKSKKDFLKNNGFIFGPNCFSTYMKIVKKVLIVKS